jgi:extracellular factor (EF) 3-hydroxypalmitic acid methyl ester biosynthesis protein
MISCGGCKEIEIFLKNEKPKNRFYAVAVDHEPMALDSARDRIYQLVNINDDVRVEFKQAEVALALLRKKSDLIDKIRDSNLIICPGLFDYLNDRIAIKIIEELYSNLAPNGELYIGNVSKANPCRFSMHFITEWKLIERNESDLISLAPDGISRDKVSVISEPLNVNLFLKLTK